MSGTYLVIPSNRMDCLREFLRAWGDRDGWDKVIVIEDGPAKTFDVESDYHYSHATINAILGKDAWIISRGDSACRCFGFLAAWWLGADRVLTMDDDCYPFDMDKGPTFVERHIQAMQHPRWVTTVPGLRVRGLPYENSGTLPDVVANCGLWMGHPDIDGRQAVKLLEEHALPRYGIPNSNWIVPNGQFVPVCGMNLMIERKALPLFYFPLMGEGQPFKRFDDIWAGVIAKTCMDWLGWRLSVGEPFVNHERASDPYQNLRKEAPGVEANETFWETVAAIEMPFWERAGKPIAMMGNIGASLQLDSNPYLSKLGKAILTWVELFARRPKGL